MAWLVAHMWVALAGVGLFGILLGWSVRGSLLVGKVRRAMVERDVSETELGQARDEIERLYAAQRKLAENGLPEGGDDELRTALRERSRELSEAQQTSQRLTSELDELKTKMDKPVVGAAALGAALEMDDASLVWRNRHLESRVRHLESLLTEAQETIAAAPATAESAASAEPVAVVTEPVAEAEKAGPSEANAQLFWRAEYLRTRTEALEAELGKLKTPVEQVSAPATDQDEELARLRWRNRYLEGRVAYFEADQPATGDEVDDAVAEVAPEPELAPEREPELAPESEIESEPELGVEAPAVEEATQDDSIATQDDANEPESTEMAAAEAPVVDGGVEEETAAEAVTEPEDAVEEAVAHEAPAEAVVEEPEEAVAVEAPEETVESVAPEPSETAQAVEPVVEQATDEDDDEWGNPVRPETTDNDADETDLDAVPEDPAAPAGVRPIALDKPVANTPDDLTQVGGIGPKIEELLNELGIWHYDQIAAWTPENITWVDEHLNFSGRITREGWVEQAGVLAGDDVPAPEDA